MSVIVVTGAAAGMGRACVERLRPTCEHLVAVDLRPPDLDGTVPMACDVSDAAAVAALVEEVSGLGRFRALVHAAGISPTMGDPARVFEVDLVGTRLLLDAFDPLVVPGAAAVCFASSAAHQLALAGLDPELEALVEDPLADGFLDEVRARFDDSGLAYAWAKRGVLRAVARAAAAWGPRGGRANSVSPGLIDTGMGRRELAAQPVMQVILDATPLGRFGRADEVAAVAAFLVSDEAAYVTGADVLVDGGAQEGLRALARG